LVVVGHVVVADQIHDSGCGNRCLELIRLGDEPFGELAAVADAFDAQSIQRFRRTAALFISFGDNSAVAQATKQALQQASGNRVAPLQPGWFG